MATFTGTPGADTFIGADAAADIFRFTPATLSSLDTVQGGLGTVSDTLEITSGGTITADQLSNVSGVEIVRFSAATSITLTAALAASSRLGRIDVFGSSGDDRVDARSFSDPSKFVFFTAGTGNDTFFGGAGADQVSIAASALTQDDVLIGGLGVDVLRISTAGALTTTALDSTFGFESVLLSAGGNSLSLSQSTVGSANGGIFTVRGGAGDDNVDASAASSGVYFLSGDGTNIFYGGSGSDRTTGGAGSDTFFGGGGADNLSGGDGVDYLQGDDGNDVLDGGNGDDQLYGVDGNDTLTGGGGNDALFGGGGNNTLIGGDGTDFMSANSGKSIFLGGAEADTIQTFSGDSLNPDIVRYTAVTDGGATGDILQGDLFRIDDGDLKFQFSRTAFNTNGNNFNKVVLDDGTIATSTGNAADGADLVIFNNGAEGQNSTNAVDSYFFNHYYEVENVGAFLVNFDNSTGTTTIYYDSDAYNFGGVSILATSTQYEAGTVAALGNDFAFFTA